MLAIEVQLGLDERIVERFRMGLSHPYPKSASSVREVIHQDALVTPLLGEDGNFYGRYVYQQLTSVTVDNRIDPPESWSAGVSETFFSRRRDQADSVIVCDDMRDLWAVVALIQDTALDKTHVVIAPTHRRVWPDAWRSQQFWKPWKRINIAISAIKGHDEVGGVERDRTARELGAMSGRDIYRIMPHEKVSWLAARLDGIRYDVFHRLLKDAVALNAADLRREEGARYGSATGQDL